MKIYIFNDNQAILKEDEKILKSALNDLKLEEEISIFQNSKDVITKLVNGENADIIFLDTSLDNDNGIDFAKTIRYYDSKCDIVLLTSTPNYATNGYEIRDLRYVQRPLMSKAVLKIIADVKIHMQKNNLLITWGTKMCTINMDSILYIERLNRKTFIYCENDETLEIQMGLSELLPLLYSSFIRYHASFIVNLKYCRQVNSNSIILSNDLAVPISRSNVVITKQQYFIYNENFSIVLKN